MWGLNTEIPIQRLGQRLVPRKHPAMWLSLLSSSLPVVLPFAPVAYEFHEPRRGPVTEQTPKKYMSNEVMIHLFCASHFTDGETEAQTWTWFVQWRHQLESEESHELPVSNPHSPPGHDTTIFQYVSTDMGYTSHKPHHAAQIKLTNERQANAGLSCQLSAPKSLIS